MRAYFALLSISVLSMVTFCFAGDMPAQEWWQGGSVRTESLGNITIALPDSSTMMDLYAHGCVSAFFTRARTNIISLSAAVNYEVFYDYDSRTIYDTERNVSLDNTQYADNYISVYLADNDLIILKPFGYVTLDTNGIPAVRYISEELQYGHSFGSIRASVSAGYLQSSSGYSQNAFKYYHIKTSADVDLPDPGPGEYSGFGLSVWYDNNPLPYYYPGLIKSGLDLDYYGTGNNGKNTFFAGFYIATRSFGFDVETRYFYTENMALSAEFGVDHFDGLKGKLGLCYDSPSIKVPLEIRAGDWTDDYYAAILVPAEDYGYYREHLLAVSGGIEITAISNIDLRLGLDWEVDDRTEYSAGIGFKPWNFIINLDVKYYNGRYPNVFDEYIDTKNIKGSADIKYIF